MNDLNIRQAKLPKGWEAKTLNQISENLDSKRVPITKSVRNEGSIPYYGASGIVDYVVDYLFDEDLLCVSEDGANLLARTYPIAFSISGKTWVNNHAHILRFEHKVSQKFVELYLNSIKLDDFVSGMAQPKLNQAMLNKIPIPLPPLPEQQRIVAILAESFEAIATAKANAEQNLKNARELFESYLQGVFENKLHGSKFETLDSLCELIVDCEHKTAPIQETGYPSIRTPNIGKGVLILEGVNRVSEKTFNEWTRRAIPQADDLILAREAPAGNIAVIPENLSVCLGQRTVLIRPKKNKIVSKFLAYLVLSKDVQEQLLSHSTGATVEHVNMKDIRAFKIFNLSPLYDQHSIVQKLDALSSETKRLEAIYQEKIADLEELKKSVLQKAFNGELKVSELGFI